MSIKIRWNGPPVGDGDGFHFHTEEVTLESSQRATTVGETLVFLDGDGDVLLMIPQSSLIDARYVPAEEGTNA